MPTKNRLSREEELQLQQLEQIDFWSDKESNADGGGALPNGDGLAFANEASKSPDLWELTRDYILHDWQGRCADNWFAAGKRGIVKVVTGAGKTTLALAIIERLQQTTVQDLRVAVVVPTVVLMDQWHSEILNRSNLPQELIGLMGGGRSASFETGARIIIAVLNSASTKLAADVEKAEVSDRLLLVVDECHRAGASQMRRIFDTKRAFNLGLSATPERESDFTDENDDEVVEDGQKDLTGSTILTRELGEVVFELNYAEAIEQSILPPFSITHYGLPLSNEESTRYKEVSREITDLQAELQTGTRRGLGLVRWCRAQAQTGNRKATRYVSLLGDRKRLLYRIESRAVAVEEILHQHFLENPAGNAILFHESIPEVMSLFQRLRVLGFAVVAEHSGFPDGMRARSIHLFREGTARVIVSARSLIEGFNVPAADIGIVVAASGSVRQRIQTLGRLLRRNRTGDGVEKSAKLYVLYARDTVDEFIYEKADWEHFIGAERNEYFKWDPQSKSSPVKSAEPPRRPPKSEDELTRANLNAGDEYPGDLGAGNLFSLDTQGNISDEQGNPITEHPELRELLKAWSRRSGRFRVTPQRLLVFAIEKDKEQVWRGLYLGRLTSPPTPSSELDSPESPNEPQSTGDVFPLARAKGETFSVLQRDQRLIALKQRGEIRFVVPLDQIPDPAKRTATAQIQQAILAAHRKGHRISKITVTGAGEVVYVFGNRAYLLGMAPEGSKGFQLEEPNHEE